MSLYGILVLGFVLGMRHATDADHVVAVSTIVSRVRSLRAAAPVGLLWGLGHTLTIVVVGGAIIVFGLVIPPRVGLALELCVAVMLVSLGVFNMWNIARAHAAKTTDRLRPSLRPIAIGMVHGVAGSAAITLLVLGAIRSPLLGVAYLFVFGAGTIAGMSAVTIVLCVPLVASVRFERFHRALAFATGIGSVAFGVGLAYRVGFVDGLFASAAH